MAELLDIYLDLVKKKELSEDKVQLTLIAKLQIVYDELVRTQDLWRRVFYKNKSVMGLYFWGSVGIGKTLLLDVFFDALPIKKKMRLHFHRFMQEVQSNLKTLQGEANPLEIVAEHFATKAQVLCFDEFFVSDIADAMILERLFTALFKRGVTLLATSNIEPDQLYWQGLHRKRFLPAIDLIKSNCTLFHLTSVADYRLRELEKAGVYFHPFSDESEQKMQHCFELYASGDIHQGGVIEIESRQIPIVKRADIVVWFDFSVICHTPRSQVDYLDIADKYPVVLISHVPVINVRDLTSVTYLINLVDVFYDNNTILILSAADVPEKLYSLGEKRFEYQRTLSRLEEMRSVVYLER